MSVFRFACLRPKRGGGFPGGLYLRDPSCSCPQPMHIVAIDKRPRLPTPPPLLLPSLCSMPPNEMIAALASNEGVSQEKMRCRIFRRGDGVSTGEFDVTELLEGTLPPPLPSNRRCCRCCYSGC